MSVEVRIGALLRIAAEDLEGARTLVAQSNRNAAYLAEQAAEKIIRAVLTSEAAHPGIKHDLAAMVGLVPDENPIKPALRAIEQLSEFATTFRYPTSTGRVKPLPTDLEKSLDLVQAALDEAVKCFGVDLSKTDAVATRPGPIR